MSKLCLSQQIFVATKICLSRQMFCHNKHTFVASKDVFCCDKHMFVMAKMMLVAAPSNDKHKSAGPKARCKLSGGWGGGGAYDC